MVTESVEMPASPSKRCSGTHLYGDTRFEELEQKISLLAEDKSGNNDLPPLKPGVDYINAREDDQMEIHGYRSSLPRTVVTWILIVCSAGLLRLIFHWWPVWMLKATHVPCKMEDAKKVLVIEHYRKYRNRYVKEITTVTPDNINSVHKVSFAPEEFGSEWVEELQNKGTILIPCENGNFSGVTSVRMFYCKKLAYLWDGSCFRKLEGLDSRVSTHVLHKAIGGLDLLEQCRRRLVYGNNEIIVEVKSIYKLLVLEILNPFYVFQIYSVCLWYTDQYMYYATAIVIMSLWGIISTITQTRKNQSRLRSTIYSSDVVSVVRKDGRVDQIPTEQLVPGDILAIPTHGCIMHCDAALLRGNCIVNESMLTGESVPVTKTPLPNRKDMLYNEKEHSRHTLFCGTQVIQTRYYGNERVVAVVLRTGFLTAKGRLVQSIMYPPPVDFRFEQDSYKFVAVLASIACIGFIYTVVTKYLRHASASDIALDSLDLITIVVPPALPAAMTVGRLFAQKQLKMKKIFCISPRSINVAGSIDCVCFDKTGTLTEDGLDMWGVVPTDKIGDFSQPIKSVDTLPTDHFLFGLASCHSLTIIDEKIAGDPLDVKMFDATKWVLEEPDVEDSKKYDLMTPTVVHPVTSAVTDGVCELGIVRQFPFSSSLQRMSVITRCLGETAFNIYCKGSPEMIASLSKPQTVPGNFSSVLEDYTQEGYRVIAMGYKTLNKMSLAKLQRLNREDVERDLQFLGLIILENRLKPETTPVLSHLRSACIRTVMVTGDNMLTALSVARDCGMVSAQDKVVMVEAHTGVKGHPPTITFTHIQNRQMSLSKTESISSNLTDSEGSITQLTQHQVNIDMESGGRYQFAVSGLTFAVIKENFPDLMNRLVVRGTVFARMSPDQKQQLVHQLQAMGYCVGMCGDGANDCGALKAAHAGISLSDAEASVASPFTYRDTNISCVPELIKEGRGALVTSFGIFKYMAGYSLIQFVSVMMMYSIDGNLSDMEFLYIDLFLITVFAFFFGNTPSYKGSLDPHPPLTSLVSLAPIISILLQIAAAIGLQVIALMYVRQQPWFTPYIPSESNMGGYENYAVFASSVFQYIALAIVFSEGSPYRRTIFSNKGLFISLLIMTVFSIYLVIYPCTFLIKLFQLVLPPTYEFKLFMLLLGVLSLVISFVIELLLGCAFRKWRYCCRNVKKSKHRHLAIEEELCQQDSWPPIDLPNPPTPPLVKKGSHTFPFRHATRNILALDPRKLSQPALHGFVSMKDVTLELHNDPS